MDYLPVVAILLLIGYGTYNWRRTGMHKYLWAMALGLGSIVVLESLSYIRHLAGISPQVHIVLAFVSAAIGMLLSIAAIAFIVTEWRR